MRNARNITGRQIAAHFLLPGIVPRLRELFQSGFGFIAVALASIYSAVRLLPAGHPYLNPANAGRFGIRHVVTAAARNLVYKRENIDQIIVFYVLLGGLCLLALQFVLLASVLFAHSVHAANWPPASFEDFFSTPNASSDVAFIMLDRVFGIPGLFLDVNGAATCVEKNIPCFSGADGGPVFNPYSTAEGTYPWPYHLALQGMFQFYSIGLLVIAALIFCYYIMAVAAETAQTGTPFGRRFNHVWAPIRLVAAFGLLIPIANGLNTAQYILLYSAKWGSGFATNGWNYFTDAVLNSTLATSPTIAGDPNSLIAAPNRPDVTKLAEFFSVAETCRAYYHNMVNIGTLDKTPIGVTVRAYLVHDSNDSVPRQQLIPGYAYKDALTFYNNQDIHIVFGACLAQVPANDPRMTGDVDCDDTPGNEVFRQNRGYVKPLCGELVMPVSSAINETTNPGAYAIQEGYFNMVRDTWLGDGQDDSISFEPDQVCDNTDVQDGNFLHQLRHWGFCWVDALAKEDPDHIHDATPPDQGDLETLMNGGADIDEDPIAGYDLLVQQIIDAGVLAERTQDDWGYGMQSLGWAGAGVWYNKIAQMNGALGNAAGSLPRIMRYPEVMVENAVTRQQNDKTVKAREVYKPRVSSGDLQLPGQDLGAARGVQLEKVLSPAFNVWDPMYPQNDASSSMFDQIVTAVFGKHNLFNMRQNVGVSPIALLAGLGDSLINGTIVSFGLGGFSTIASGLFDGTQPGFFAAMGSLFNTIGMTLMTTGFILYYVVPFLPFLYFFFAVGAWVKGIFESMVGVPLWALAHIRIDGEGLAGSAALGGYFMIFEVFLRPILIVFGMLASILLFSAQVFVLNDIWDLVTSNLTGFEHNNPATDGGTGSVQWMRDKMDQFFFTIIYAFVVYMLGTSSFKLITFLPQRVMRWMGSGVSAFSDQETDPGQGLTGKIEASGAIASNIGQTGSQGLSSITRGLASSVGVGKK